MFISIINPVFSQNSPWRIGIQATGGFLKCRHEVTMGYIEHLFLNPINRPTQLKRIKSGKIFDTSIIIRINKRFAVSFGSKPYYKSQINGIHRFVTTEYNYSMTAEAYPYYGTVYFYNPSQFKKFESFIFVSAGILKDAQFTYYSKGPGTTLDKNEYASTLNGESSFISFGMGLDYLYKDIYVFTAVIGYQLCKIDEPYKIAAGQFPINDLGDFSFDFTGVFFNAGIKIVF